jgi:CBS-domain-containing membrane protein
MVKLIDVKILKIFVSEAVRHKGAPLYDVIVNEARRRGMAGASVSRGVMGFGASNLLHTAKILRLAEDLPVIVEIVDTPSRIANLLPVVDALVEEGSIVVQDGQAIFHLPMRIRDVMTEQVVTVGTQTPLNEVVELLLRREVKAVPVMEAGRLVGIITGGDLLGRARMPLRLDMHGHVPTNLRHKHNHYIEFEGLRARDIMSAPVTTLNITTTVTDALKMMAARNIKRLPVTSEDGTLMGIVSRTDVLAAIGRTSAVAAHLDVLPAGVHACARDVLYTNVPTAAPDAPLAEVLQLLVASALRRVVIVDADKTILGIIHDWDLLQCFVRQNSPTLVARLLRILTQREAVPTSLEGTAEEVMSREVLTVGPDAPLSEVIQILMDKKVKRLVVADQKGHLLGMVDRDVILKALARQISPAQ